jgi:hypothetical protein
MEVLKKKSDEYNKLSFQVEEKTFLSSQQFLIGREIKKVAGISLDAKLYLQNKSPWADNLIEDDEEVDLARPGIEYFFVEKNFELTVNTILYNWRQRFITGQQVRELSGIEKGDELFLRTSNSRIDQLIDDDDKIDLLQSGIEEFYSEKQKKTITLIISGVSKAWDKEKISFKEVIMLAYGSYEDSPTMVYTVAYEDGPKQNPEGSMIKGSEVYTKNKMIFHATATNQS